ncbi:MAG: hypothetical protein HXY18_04665 [Bryobacteraceae bacterium]|nr:hypothetical protein [Bryobacteraceae bacterium]
MTRAQFFLTAIGAAAAAHELQSPARTLLGTFEGFVNGGLNLRVKAGDGTPAVVETGAATEVKRVAPGDRSLQHAQTIGLDELKPGDRLLISYAPSSVLARRIVVMPAAAIADRNEALRREWNEHGLSGVVVSKKPGEIVLRQRSLLSESQAAVVLSPATKFRQYRAGSNTYAESQPSSFEQIRAGDQLRARGAKPPDGRRIEADEVVFGTFVIKAGAVLSMDGSSNTLTVRDLDTDRPLPVRLTPASQVKRFPEFPTAPAGMAGAASTPGLPPSPPGPGGPPDLAQMIERLPGFSVQEIKPGDTVVFSASPGKAPGELLAVLVLTNASRLVQMAQARSSRQTQQLPGAIGLGGMNGAGVLDLSGFLP